MLVSDIIIAISMLNQLLTNQFFIQFIGVVALIFALLIFQVDNRKSMLKYHTVASLFFSIHYFLLGAYTGSTVAAVNIFRNYSFFKFENRKFSWLLPLLFIAVFLVVIALSWQGWISILPMISAVCGTLAFWQDKPRLIRIFSFIITPVWLIYDALVGSYPGMIAEFIILSSDVVGVCRYDLFKNHTLKEFKLHVHRKRLHA